MFDQLDKDFVLGFEVQVKGAQANVGLVAMSAMRV